jgi:hypothetical protein
LEGLILLIFVHNVHTLEAMSSAYYVSGRVPARYERLVTKQARAAGTSKSDLSGREAHLTGHRVAVWEVVVVHQETRSMDKTARHFGWPRVLVKRALAYDNAFPEEISRVTNLPKSP